VFIVAICTASTGSAPSRIAFPNGEVDAAFVDNVCDFTVVRAERESPSIDLLGERQELGEVLAGRPLAQVDAETDIDFLAGPGKA